MKEIIDLLKEHDFFKEMPPKLVDDIAECGEKKSYKSGENLDREGDPADYMYIIRSGRIAVQLHHPTKGDLTIMTLNSGDLAGFSWIIPPYRMQFDLKALEKTSVIEFDAKCLRDKCEKDYHLGYLLMQRSAAEMEKRLHSTRIQLLDVYGTTN